MLVEIVSLLEFVDASACVNKFLFAREVRMALGANFNTKFVDVLGGTGLECVSACTHDCYVMVFGMDSFFHFGSPESFFFTPTRASMLREYDIKFLYYIFLTIKCQAYASTLRIFFACSCHTLFSRFASYFASAASNRLRSTSRSRSVSARDFLSLVMLPLSATCTGLPSSTKYSSAQSKHSSIA